MANGNGNVPTCKTFANLNLAMWPLPNTFENLLHLEREGVAVMFIQSLLLESSPLLLGEGLDGGHGHTACSSGTGKG